MPALTKFVDGTGPVWSGNLFPVLFITIACGGSPATSHALISSAPRRKCWPTDKPGTALSATAAC
ncbi:hypothetical protein LN650_23565 [Klebsiella pneumoniae subsp. pneumoniae]|nr:hypothetical protein [Klebsiella pneumoniae subsp. pneumoniae]